jgi:hypothetical protein
MELRYRAVLDVLAEGVTAAAVRYGATNGGSGIPSVANQSPNLIAPLPSFRSHPELSGNSHEKAFCC